MWKSVAGLTLCLAMTAADVVQPGEKAEIEIVALTSDGFRPAKISRRAGPFTLAIENRTGASEDYKLKLETAAKVQLKEIDISKRHINHGELLRLPAGTYFVNVQGKSKITLTIEVKP